MRRLSASFAAFAVVASAVVVPSIDVARHDEPSFRPTASSARRSMSCATERCIDGPSTVRRRRRSAPPDLKFDVSALEIPDCNDLSVS
jgi:hypothetical protein